MPLALWVDRVIVKKAIGYAPFDLIYGIQERLPQNNLSEMYKFIQAYEEDIIDEIQIRMDDILQLDETRRDTSIRNSKFKIQVKHLYDKKTVVRKFKLEDLVLLWNARQEDKGKHGNFEPIWLGPYLIHENWGEDSYFIREISRDIMVLPVHGQFLKRYL